MIMKKKLVRCMLMHAFSSNIVEQYFDKLIEVEQFYHRSIKI